ncbi:MAG: SRPBCC family protein [Deltaproteobacteria bacterium]|nr:MAG: SRPBCC family protein [Deltaproteobacteria bacterium]
MAEISLTHAFAANPDALWDEVGFGKLADFHPLVPNLVLSEEGTVRTMGFGPMTAVERLVEQNERSYTYVVDKSPMPVRDYRATWTVRPEGSGAVLAIHATYEPKGPAAVADELLNAFFAAGFKALEARLAS